MLSSDMGVSIPQAGQRPFKRYANPRNPRITSKFQSLRRDKGHSNQIDQNVECDAEIQFQSLRRDKGHSNALDCWWETHNPRGFNPSGGTKAIQTGAQASRSGQPHSFNPSGGTKAIQTRVSGVVRVYPKVSIPQAGQRPFKPVGHQARSSLEVSFNPSGGTKAIQTCSSGGIAPSDSCFNPSGGTKAIQTSP